MSANEIIKGLWLGDIAAANDEIFLHKNNIKTIFNITKNTYNKIPGITYYQITIDDPGPNHELDEENIKNFLHNLPWITQVMHNELSDKKNILVHCHAGIQRSAATVVAYLMRYGLFRNGKKINMVTAFNIVRKGRPKVFYYGQFINFKPALLMFDRNLKNC